VSGLATGRVRGIVHCGGHRSDAPSFPPQVVEDDDEELSSDSEGDMPELDGGEPPPVRHQRVCLHAWLISGDALGPRKRPCLLKGCAESILSSCTGCGTPRSPGAAHGRRTWRSCPLRGPPLLVLRSAAAASPVAPPP
jgi:hypothetical protein